MKKSISYEEKLSELRRILLYSAIDEKSAKEVVSKLIVMSNESRKKPIILEINSPGGNVTDGIAIMNTIQLVANAPIVTVINGEACSMAGFISIVGDKRLITPNSHWMGHPISDTVWGSPKTIKDRGLYLERLEQNLHDIFKNKTKLTDKEFEQMLRGELWLNDEECLKKGIVDEIIPREYLTQITKFQEKRK